MRAIFIITALTLLIGVLGSADAKPPGSCEPWPECKEGDDGSGDAPAFSDICKNLNQWTVTGNWSVSRGECSVKNTDAEHVMVTATDIDLSGALEAHLSYKYRIENADIGEFMRISVSLDGGATFIVLKEYVGSESGTVSFNLADQIPFTDPIKLRASCLVSANNEVCGWDNIKIETVTNPPDELVVRIHSKENFRPRCARCQTAPPHRLSFEQEGHHLKYIRLSRSGLTKRCRSGENPLTRKFWPAGN